MSNEEKPAQLKGMIIEYARKGAFDNSPLVSTAHSVTCTNCKCRQNIVLLDYLKSGEFDFGKPQQVEVLITEGIIEFLEKETFTPIVTRLVCKGCGFHFEIKLINLEYLKTIIDRPKVSRTMYA